MPLNHKHQSHQYLGGLLKHNDSSTIVAVMLNNKDAPIGRCAIQFYTEAF